jgi:nucleoside-diphosphate-sugar epimerase
MDKTVLILGVSGKIGSHSGEAFARAGWAVRTYDRRASNLSQMAQGVDVIVNGFNPPAYHDWARLIPRITNEVIQAASVSGATVIVPGNVYNIGAQGGEWSEMTPHRPTTRKGRIREEMELTYEASGVRTVILRAGNFIDPRHNGDVMSLLFMRSIRRGVLTVAGDPGAMQSYCYVPDWARAAVLLAEKRTALAKFEDVPFAGHSFTAEQLRDFASQHLGRPIRFEKFPWWALSLTAPFWELAREMLEMRYLWSTPHTLSGTKLQRLAPEFEATPLEQVMRAGLPDDLGASVRRVTVTRKHWSQREPTRSSIRTQQRGPTTRNPATGDLLWCRADADFRR